MSLINKMLQDLESRKNAQADTVSKKSVYEDLQPVNASGFRAPPNKRLSIILLALAVAGGGAYAWMQWGEKLLSHQPAVVKTRPVAAHKAPPKPAAAPAPAPVATVAAIPAPAVPVAEKLKDMPATNAQAVNTVPPPQAEPETNTVPVPPPAEPKNTSAPAPTAEPATEGGYWTVAKGETLYSISAKTGIDLLDLSKWNHLGRNHVIYSGQRLRLTPPDSMAAKLAMPDHNNERNIETKKANRTVASVKKPAALDSAPKAAPALSPGTEEGSADSGVMNKKLKPLSPDEQAESEYRQAVNLLQKGRAADAEKRLQAALNLSAVHTPSRELLAGLALQNGRWQEAQQILEQGIEKVPAYYPFALLLARIQIEHGTDQKALAVMEASRRAGAGSADYMAFLGELYRRAGDHAEAIKAYTEAIKLNPREGRSWIGMGISLEAARDWKNASDAYQRAVETGTLDDNLLKYANQRLAIVKNK
ncbi:MAG: tetratricopeptide repeat protein [Sulfuricaulis sp.]|uniref:tetratricopeptide repeat protein n=1 Tax=Sulfuricaulis sp. TaxID=2003553 RepID=UPI003C66D305